MRELLLGFADTEHEAPIRKVLGVLNQRHQLAVIPDNAVYMPTSSQRWAVISRHSPVSQYVAAISHVYKTKCYIVVFRVKHHHSAVETFTLDSHPSISKQWLSEALKNLTGHQAQEIPYNYAVRRLKQEFADAENHVPAHLPSHWRRELNGIEGEIPHPAEQLLRVNVHPRDMVLAVENEPEAAEWYLPAVHTIPCMDQIARVEGNPNYSLEQKTAYIIDLLYGDMESMFEFIDQSHLLLAFRDMAWWLHGDGNRQLSAIYNGMADSIAEDGAKSVALKALLPKTVEVLRERFTPEMRRKIKAYSKRAMVA
ncbi:MAG: hypothetical protein K8R88_14670 [Armatimonadetes bacterium]|nr:hypothetical protein [Armatimonadota bacterium]